jgi:hypothetical protein
LTNRDRFVILGAVKWAPLNIKKATTLTYKGTHERLIY